MISYKQKVKKCFDNAATTYNEAAFIQSQAGIELVRRLTPKKLTPTFITDIGSGTGFLAKQLAIQFPASMVACVDFAEKMLMQARTYSDYRNINYIKADFDRLPFASSSIDLVCSNFALQWSLSLPQTFSELSRILKPGGHLAFSTLGPSTLHELRECWERVDSDNHSNHYDSVETLQKNLDARNIKIIDIESSIMTMYFPSVKHVMRNLKSVGANHVMDKKSKNLMTKKKFDRFMHNYEHYRNNINLLPVSYEVIYVMAVKRGE